MTGESASLGEVADFVNGVAFKEADWSNEGRPIIRIQNLNDPTKPFNFTTRDVAERNLARRGDLLVSWAASLGVYKWGGEEACINQHIFKVIPDRKVVEPEYLKRALETSLLSMERQTHGATMKHITRDRFLAIRIPLPVLAEQRRIAAILDKADELRTKRREVIVMLDQLLESVFLDMFGEPLSNPKKWPRRALRDIASVQTGGTPPTAEADLFEGAVPFITPGDLGGHVLAWRRSLSQKGAARTRVAPAGSTLVCCIGAIGKMGMVHCDSAFNQQINAVTWGDEVTPLFGYHAMRFLSAEIAHRGASTTLPILKKSEFEKLELIVPSGSEQELFRQRAEQVTRQAQVADASRDKLDVMFGSLRQRVFGGGW